MAEKIRVLIVDDSQETRENVRKLLQFEQDLEVVGQASNGQQAIEAARTHEPDVILMDINMPGVDGIAASQSITQSVPSAQIIIMSVQSEADYLRRAMLAGARDFLMKPFSGDELVAAIRRVYETRPKLASSSAGSSGSEGSSEEGGGTEVEHGKVITVYSTKGGSGCTTIAINTAVALAQRGHKVALVDISLQFGDVAVTLNMRPQTTIIDLIDRINELDQDLLSSVMIDHDSGLKVLLAPAKPEMAELVTPDHIELLLRRMGEMFDYVLVDTPSSLNEVTLISLDVADRILLVTQQSLASLTGARRFFDLIDQLNYDAQKVMLVANHVSNKRGISVKDVADALKRPVVSSIQSDEEKVNMAADQGVPVVNPKAKRNTVAYSLLRLADSVEMEFSENGSISINRDEGQAQEKKSFWARLFGR